MLSATWRAALAGLVRLAAEDVEHRGREVARVEGVEQVLIDHVAAAGGVDHRRAPGQAGEVSGADDPLGLRGQRQEADQDLGARKEPLEAVVAVEAPDAFDLLRAPAPAGDVEPEPRELERGMSKRLSAAFFFC